MRKYRTFACDFETTVYEGQDHTEVWSAALVELETEDVKIWGNIGDMFEYFTSLNTNVIAYFHNLKFDGSFWLDYLLKRTDYKQGYIMENQETKQGYFVDTQDMEDHSFKYVISAMGNWYSITIKNGKYLIDIRDSLKLLPFSLDRIGKSFQTKHKKLQMEYEGYRYANCPITLEERQYIANDVLVLKEALEIMFSEGHKKLTIGSCCLAEYKKSMLCASDWEEFFPDLTEIALDKETFGSSNADQYIRKSYRGGWCYVARGKEKKKYYHGCTADVNSLYPSMMSGESGNLFPVGLPHFWKGDLPESVININPEYPRYFFVRIKTRFYIKEGKLPFVQLKNTMKYKQNECLETSDVCINGKYYKNYVDVDGKICDGRVTMTMTQTDYKLFLEHYNVEDLEVLDGCWFHTETGIFDRYIDKYRTIKMNSKGAKRELAKIFLNNLYGKIASSTESSFKYADLKDGIVHFTNIPENKRKVGYIPIGSAITSYARNFTIRAAQANYYGPDKEGFIYADTDSIHCDLRPEQIKGITIHQKNFCCWKIESEWDLGFFTRQKTYIERIVVEDGEKIEKPWYNIKCAGMPGRCKYLFNLSLGGDSNGKETKPLTDEEQEFVSTHRSVTDFDIGLCVPSKLMPKRINGGVVLQNTTFEMR